MTERELFERAYKWNYPNAELSWCKVTKSYKDPTEMRCWSMWQAATQREGFKFVPVNPDNEVISSLASVICDEFDTIIDGSAHCAKEACKAMIGAVDE